jgi:RNA ligase
MVETATGLELPWEENPGFIEAKRYPSPESLSELASWQKDNQEGFVVRFASGFRVKVKMSEYVRLHRLLTGINERHIWEMLMGGQALDDILRNTPDDYQVWAKDVVARLQGQFDAIIARATEQYRVLEDRKTTALYFQQCEYPHVMFRMLDYKDFAEPTWRMLRPENPTTFRYVSESVA